jgi:hypothetical protein
MTVAEEQEALNANDLHECFVAPVKDMSSLNA